MVTPTWQDRELRILEHVVQAWEDGGYAEVADIAEAIDLGYKQTVRVVNALRGDGYLTGVGVAEDPHLLRIEPTAKAREATRQRPAADPISGVPIDIDEDGPIFVVHGSNLDRAREVAHVIERGTELDATILHEQPSRGRTILEKFEHHATAASFAVVVLTADDQGRKIGEDSLRPRGRQNVVLELGFFFGVSCTEYRSLM